MAYVPLDRQFIDWDERDASQAEVHRYLGKMAGGTGWPDLLSRSRVVILAEAGSGKTEELREQARILAAEGKFAFYATVQDVAHEGLGQALPVAAKAKFDEWKSSDQPAWFFIDSIDEAKLDSIRLETALHRISDGIYGAQARATIILSGRYSDWEFRADLEKLETYLPIPQAVPTPAKAPDEALVEALRNERTREPSPAKEKARVVVMAALDEDRIRRFAAGKGVKELDDFMAEIELGNLWRLAERPIDLSWLVDYWQKNRRFGSLSTMLETSLRERLKEFNLQLARKDPIEEDRAMEALERIGASLVFGKADKILVPDSDLTAGTSTDGFHLADILPDWSPEHRARLLGRATFDPATFGRVRLHNDNEGVVRSYLTARWLSARRKANCSVQTLFRILFADTYGVSLIRPSLAQTCAWLSIWDGEVAREAIKRDPRLLLSAGDPASLPVALRHEILGEVVKRILSGQEPRAIYDREAIRRFSTPDMASQVRNLWEAHQSEEEVRLLLLLMIEQGKLVACADIAVEAAFAGYSDHHTRVFAGRALFAVGDQNARQRYASMLTGNAENLPSRVLWEGLEELVPDQIGVDPLTQIIGKMDVEMRDETLGMAWRGPRLVQKLSSRADIGKLLTHFLSRMGPSPSTFVVEESAEEKAFGPGVAEAALKLLDFESPDTVPTIVIDAALRLGADRHRGFPDDRVKELQKAVAETAARRRAVLWRAVERLRDHPLLQGKALTNVFQLEMLGWPRSLHYEDAAWLIEDIEGRASVEDKVLATGAVLGVWRANGQPDALLTDIRRVALQTAETKAQFEFWTTPPEPSPEEIELQKTAEEARTKRAQNEAERDTSWKEFIGKLRENPSQLRQLSPPTEKGVDGRLFGLWQLLNNVSRDGSHYAIDDLSPLEPILGPELTEATREALIAFWRQWKPKLQTERSPDNRNSISMVDCMGIVGVSLEAKANVRWATRLSECDAIRAAEFATLELNGFPAWFLSLVEAQPSAAKNVLIGEIIAEIDRPSPGPPTGTIHDVVYAPIEVARLVAPELLGALKDRDRLDDATLAAVLTVLTRGLSEHTQQREFSGLCIERFAANPTGDTGPRYLAAAYSFDPIRATEALTAALDALKRDDQRSLVERLLPAVVGDGFSRPSLAVQTLPFEVIERLVPLAFDIVRLDEDLNRQCGEVYSAGQRDHAEHARNAVFSMLTSTRGRPSFEFLRRLKDVKGFPVPPDRLEELALRRAAEDSDLAEWPPGEPYQLESEFDLAPRTAEELQRVALGRIEDIQHALLHGDFNQGLTVKRLSDERAVQNWVAAELRNREGRAYSVEREPHVVEEKEPDIRLRTKVNDASLPIEIKVPDSLPLSLLEEALTDQLGGRYLRAQDGKHGVLLLVHQQPRRDGWRTKDGGYLGIREVAAHLQLLADEAAAAGTDAPKAQIALIDVSSVREPAKSGRKKHSA